MLSIPIYIPLWPKKKPWKMMKTIAKSGRKRRFQVFNIGVKVFNIGVHEHCKPLEACHSQWTCLYLSLSVCWCWSDSSMYVPPSCHFIRLQVADRVCVLKRPSIVVSVESMSIKLQQVPSQVSKQTKTKQKLLISAEAHVRFEVEEKNLI